MTEDTGFKILLALCGFLSGALAASGLMYATIITSRTKIAALEAWQKEEALGALKRSERIAALEGDMKVDAQWRLSVADDIHELKEDMKVVREKLEAAA